MVFSPPSFTRFIPTLVGNTLLKQAGKQEISVHPHTCGEHCICSSVYVAFTRFIPTLVGNTKRGIDKFSSMPVHPHTCGEHILKSILSLVIFGSSPHLWGTLCSKNSTGCSWRFIPTLVGNTMSNPLICAGPTVHPHTCGEHIVTVSGEENGQGSSPHLWGTLSLFHIQFFVIRFIPTLVGNTLHLLYYQKECRIRRSYTQKKLTFDSV